MFERPKISGSSAFTLTEMLVVIGILGVLFALTMPFVVPFFRQPEIDRVDTMIQMTALRARSLAIEQRRLYSLILDEQRNRIMIQRTQDGATAEEPQYLPEPALLLRGTFPGSVIFAPSGGLTTPTNLDGFHFVGRPKYEGAVQSATGTELTVSGSPWQPDNYRNYFVAITKSSDARGQVRLIASNSDNTLTVSRAWSPVPTFGDQFRILAPNDVRRIIIYSTTGQVVSSMPQE